MATPDLTVKRESTDAIRVLVKMERRVATEISTTNAIVRGDSKAADARRSWTGARYSRVGIMADATK